MSPWTNDGAAEVIEIGKIAGVGEEVEGNNLVRRMVVEHVPDIGGPDESRASGDDDAHRAMPPDVQTRPGQIEFGRQART